MRGYDIKRVAGLFKWVSKKIEKLKATTKVPTMNVHVWFAHVHRCSNCVQTLSLEAMCLKLNVLKRKGLHFSVGEREKSERERKNRRETIVGQRTLKGAALPTVLMPAARLTSPSAATMPMPFRFSPLHRSCTMVLLQYHSMLC